MKTDVVAMPLLMRLSAVIFAAVMLASFVWYSQSRAQVPSFAAAAMFEGKSKGDRPSVRHHDPSLLSSSKIGPVTLPLPEWVLVRQSEEPEAKLDEGKSTMLFLASEDSASIVFFYSFDRVQNTLYNYSFGKGFPGTSADIFSSENVFGGWMSRPFEPPSLFREHIPFPDLSSPRAQGVNILKASTPMLMSTSKSGLILPPMPVGNYSLRAENIVREAMKHLFHQEPAVSAAKP